MSHDAWLIEREAMGPQPAQHFDLGASQVAVTGNRQRVRLTAGAGDGWSAEFSAPTGRHLDAGETFVGRFDDLGSTSAAGLGVVVDSTHCGVDLSSWDPDPSPSIGTFTIQEAAYDPDGNVTRFAATFEENCQSTSEPAVRGSVAADAWSTPSAVPPPSPTPGPVTGLKLSNVAGYQGSYYMNTTKLTWTNPPAPAWAATYVGYGGDFSWRARYLDGELQLYRGSGTTMTTYVDGIQTDLAFQAIGISPVGRLGPISTIGVTGTRMPVDISRGTITMGGSTVLTGKLVESIDYGDDPADIFSGPGLPGRRLDVYSKPPHASWDSFRYLGHVTTGAGGRFSFPDSPDQNTSYEVRWRGSPQYLGNATYQETVANVAPQVDLVASRSSARKGGTVTFTTARRTTGSRGIVLLQRLDGHTWRTVAKKRITRTAGRAGKRVAIHYRARAAGKQPFRMVKPGDARHVNGVSRTVRVTVH